MKKAKKRKNKIKIIMIKILCLIGIVTGLVLLIYGNLLKGVAGSNESPLSLQNIIKVGAFFIVMIAGWVFLERVIKRK